MLKNQKPFLHLLSASCLLFSLPSHASPAITGTLTATQACPAYVSFQRQYNPDQLKIQVNESYRAISINKKGGDWIRILIPSVAKHQARWINQDCGTLNTENNTIKNPDSIRSNKRMFEGAKSCNTPNDFDSYVLALTWQPGFCKHQPNSKSKPECKALLSGKKSFDYLTLHGLWPNKKQCGIDYGYCNPNATLDLTPTTIKAIAPWMPNFYYQTKFGAYEWKKHGTCQSLSDDQYFLEAIGLVKEVNKSAIGQYIKDNQNKSIDVKDFKSYLEKKLGAQAVSHIQLVCAKKRYLEEIRIQLPKNFSQQQGLINQMSQAPKARSFYGNCRSTIHIDGSTTSFWNKF